MATDLSSDISYHSHYIKFRGNSTTSFSFSVQLWNLADFKNATIRIALSVLPLPLSGGNLYKFKTGIELIIKNNGIGFIGSEGQVSYFQRNILCAYYHLTIFSLPSMTNRIYRSIISFFPLFTLSNIQIFTLSCNSLSEKKNKFSNNF